MKRIIFAICIIVSAFSLSAKKPDINALRIAAEQGDTKAQMTLGDYYKKGKGVKKDKEQALYWYGRAAEQGDAENQFNLGMQYLELNDYKQAIYWYKKAAEQNHLHAQVIIGCFYYMGEGVSKDWEEAAKWFKMAADQGNDEAMKKYRELRAQGYGINTLEKVDMSQQAQPQATLNAEKVLVQQEQQAVVQQSSSGATDRSADTDIPVTGIRQDNTFAVIIGNENYHSVAKVPYAVNDAKVFAEYCKKTLGLPDENVSVYTDVTYGKMLGAIARLQKIADAYCGNIDIIFYYAGHGIPDDASREAFILPTDADGTIKEVCYPLRNLYSTLAGVGAKRVMVFIDACFSGSQRGDGMLQSARGTMIKPKNVVVDGNMVVFSAVSGDQTAYPYKPSEHGLFTYYLLKKLKESRGDVSLGELSDYITTNVKQRSIVVNDKLQTPEVVASEQLSSSWRTLRLR